MINKEDEAKPDEESVLRFGSMILNFAEAKKDYKHKRLIFVDINITGRMSAFVDSGASDLFILDKIVGKLGLSISKSAKKIRLLILKMSQLWE